MEALRKFNANTRGAIRESNEMRLLQAAETVFAARGFSGATTAEIATRAKLPKANLHYYFRTKAELYRAVLANVLELWLDELDRFTSDREPTEAIAEYVAAKLNWSRKRPNASKVFANEVLHGAPFLKAYLSNDLRRRVEDKSEVVRHWIAQGKMRPLDPKHFFFQLWAVTQHYADFDVQVRAVLGRGRLTDQDFATAAENITALILHGCLVPARTRPA
ncbi:transcriptional regulator, TetR family [Enhydrobacter aerosaccus]|uniref:Transcriptional regulator, TetR family n=1 Tax=Enhydrobacter aerosaccus TaxID=225324 RepID=A0A1T4N4L4_9HYPH|nr:TetR/AcrR family transcriptional regulator [Enhydrobacter aerosaccus]SJZ74017.1 transcriptional regulator, TetR family [Enhydrobacter aerosaccus]